MNYKCNDCYAEFTEMEQTQDQYDQGICPYCGGQDIAEVEDVEEDKDTGD